MFSYLRICSSLFEFICFWLPDFWYLSLLHLKSHYGVRFFFQQRFLYAAIKSSVGLVYDKLNRLHFSSLSLQHIFSEFHITIMAELCLFYSFNICVWHPVSEWECYSRPNLLLLVYVKLHVPYFPLDCWSPGNICCSVHMAHIACHLAVLLLALLKCIRLNSFLLKSNPIIL